MGAILRFQESRGPMRVIDLQGGTEIVSEAACLELLRSTSVGGVVVVVDGRRSPAKESGRRKRSLYSLYSLGRGWSG